MPADPKLAEREGYNTGFAAGHAAGFKAGNDRMMAVFASEHFAGREAAAAKLLIKNMTATDITDVLATLPRSPSAALRRSRADAVWARARASNQHLPVARSASPVYVVWDRARSANRRADR
jgi:hypothetical protein